MVMVSKCCDSRVLGALSAVEGIDDEVDTNLSINFGKCSECGDFTFFDEVGEEHAKLLENSKTPYTLNGHVSSADKLKIIGPNCGFSEDVIANFNPAIISWVAERVGITAEDGVPQALADGHFVINTAREIDNDAQVKLPIVAGTGTVLNTLNQIAEAAENVLTMTNQKVVFHCAMGMERSVLACIWLMASRWRMQLHQSLRQIRKQRPIALDRTNWITL